MPLAKQDVASSPSAPIARRSGECRRSLLLLSIAAVLVWGSSLAAAPAASAAKGQALQPYTGPVTRAGGSSKPAPEGTSTPSRATSRAVPLLSPDPAALRLAKERAASHVAGGGGRSPQTISPLPHAAVFEGLNNAGMSAAESGGSTTPPDTTGAIGPNHYVEFVNGTGITAYDRELNKVSGPVALESFIGFPSDEVFDPQIQWDENWGRWIYVMDHVENAEHNFLAFGWSKTADPSNLSTGSGGGWCGYFLATGEEFGDYPKLGHSDNGITIGTNVFTSVFLGSQLWTIAKPAEPETCPTPLSVALTTLPLETEDGDVAFTPVPANTADSSANGYVVAADSPFEVSEPKQIMAWHFEGAGVGATLIQDGNMEVAAYDFPANVPQPGTSQVIDSLDARLTNAVAVTDPAVGEEAVWTQHTVNGPGNRSVVRWYELLPEAEPEPEVRQEGTISDPSQFIFNGAISPTAQGNAAAIDFNRGGETLFPEMRARSRDANTPLGQMVKDVQLGTSAGHAVDFSCGFPLEPCRWGDYAGASPDPSQSGIVWGSNQGLAAPSGAFARWTTRNFALFTDVTAPAAPSISGTDPASPANDNNPKVKGSAEAGSTVRVFESPSCSGPVAGEGGAATFASAGIAVSVADNTTTPLSANASDDAGNTSACSSSSSYTESTPSPSPAPSPAPSPSPVPPPPPMPPPPGIAVAKNVALVKGGKALLKLTCRGAGACRGSLELVARVQVGTGANSSKKRARNLVIGRAGFAIPAGRAKTIRVRLTGKGKRLLGKAGKHGLKVKLRGSGVRNRTVRLREAKKKK
jgi:hypothetical protein